MAACTFEWGRCVLLIPLPTAVAMNECVGPVRCLHHKLPRLASGLASSFLSSSSSSVSSPSLLTTFFFTPRSFSSCLSSSCGFQEPTEAFRRGGPCQDIHEDSLRWSSQLRTGQGAPLLQPGVRCAHRAAQGALPRPLAPAALARPARVEGPRAENEGEENESKK